MAIKSHSPQEISRLRIIDSTADRFEAAWQAGAQPCIEEFLAECSTDLSQTLLTELLTLELEWRARQKQVFSQEDYLKRFPGDSEVVSSVFTSWSHSENQYSTVAEKWPTAIRQGMSTVADSQPSRSSDADLPGRSECQFDSDREIPTHIGRYEVIKLLGTGAMGNVYLARDQKLHRHVALKVSKLNDETEKSDRMERFQREARAAATLHQPNLCPVYDIGQVDGLHFITMAYINGQTLQETTKSGKRYTPHEAVNLTRKLALALQCAHVAKVVHRDLKPANIMIDQQNEPIIMDFGLALLSDNHDDARITQSGMIIGSPAYMSPEQVSGKRDAVGPACDVYSLGVILYELLTNRLPYEGNVLAVIDQIRAANPKSVRMLRPEIDIELATIVEKMMSGSVETRYSSMQAVVADLENWLNTQNDRLPVHRERYRIPVSRAVFVATLVGVFILGAAGILLSLKTENGRVLVEFDGIGKPIEVDVAEDKTIKIQDPNDGAEILVTIDAESKQLMLNKHGFQMAVKQFSLESPEGRRVKVSFLPSQSPVTNIVTIPSASADVERSIVDIMNRFETEPSIEDDYSADRVLVDDTTTFLATENERLVFARKQPNHGSWGGWWAYPRFSYKDEGLLNVDLRAVGDHGGWIVDLNHKKTVNGKNTYDGLRIVYNQNQISVGASIFDPRRQERDTQLEKVLAEQTPLNGNGEFNSLQLFIQKRLVHVYWNGQMLGTPVVLPYELDSATVLVGGVGSPDSPTRAEFRRLEFRRLKSN
ncbi:serine/threonine protein kinase [Stieleria varia]|uniref:non-specific serine/threonine protein kinase n=1 Tax=Stieleria varia TaxID=2528005 RepID=A0A5C6AUV9_9BACT|nr:serine/threonine-protein kinase [Stieleria varia]TWU02989.1 Serine/threonine-protein kinase PrkC [Stieleria varia]